MPPECSDHIHTTGTEIDRTPHSGQDAPKMAQHSYGVLDKNAKYKLNHEEGSVSPKRGVFHKLKAQVGVFKSVSHERAEKEMEDLSQVGGLSNCDN